MNNKKAFLVAGLGFGDEGKGTTVDFLTRKYNAHTVIRYNGGAQAGHNVITKDGRQHVFSQFGSGTFIPEVKTYLSRFMVVNPITMVTEEEHLRKLGIEDAFARTIIDGRALVVTPFHKITNWLREISRGQKKHGSCGMGIGETINDYRQYGDNSLFIKDLTDFNLTRDKLEYIRSKKIETISTLNLPDNAIVREKLEIINSNTFKGLHDIYYKLTINKLINSTEDDYLTRLLNIDGSVIFEGAQGILLDPKYGFTPHVTKTDITFSNALALLKEASYKGGVRRIGVLRAYATRHGAGPFPTESENLTQSLQDSHNPEGPWQGRFRVGYFDTALTKHALSAIGSLDDVVLTNLDRLKSIEPLKICTRYNLKDNKPIYKTLPKVRSRKDCFKYLEFLHDLNIPVSMASFGPTAEDKIIL